MTGADKLLTVPEAAARLRVEITTVRQYLRDGRLTGSGGGDFPWRIPESAIQEFIDAHSNVAVSSGRGRR